MDTSKMTKAELQAYITKLEAQAISADDRGRIWPDVSKAVKDGKEKTSVMVLRGVNADPRKTVNLYPSQFARLLQQLPSIIDSMLDTTLWSRFSFRNEAERHATHAYLTAYRSELSPREDS